jgi:hypothetical protein
VIITRRSSADDLMVELTITRLLNATSLLPWRASIS